MCYMLKNEYMHYLHITLYGFKLFEHLLILVSPVTGCVSNSDFASLVVIPIDIESSTVGLKICAITA